MNLLRKIGQDKPKPKPGSEYEPSEQNNNDHAFKSVVLKLQNYYPRGDFIELAFYDPLSFNTTVCFVENEGLALKIGHLYKTYGYESISLGNQQIVLIGKIVQQ